MRPRLSSIHAGNILPTYSAAEDTRQISPAQYHRYRLHGSALVRFKTAVSDQHPNGKLDLDRYYLELQEEIKLLSHLPPTPSSFQEEGTVKVMIPPE